MNNRFAGITANLLHRSLAIRLTDKGDIICKWSNRSIVVRIVREGYLM